MYYLVTHHTVSYYKTTVLTLHQHEKHRQTTYLCSSSQQLNFFLLNVCCHVTQFRLCVDCLIMHSCGSLIKLMSRCGCLMTLVSCSDDEICFFQLPNVPPFFFVDNLCLVPLYSVLFILSVRCFPNFYIAFVCNGEYAILGFLYFISWFGPCDHVTCCLWSECSSYYTFIAGSFNLFRFTPHPGCVALGRYPFWIVE